MKKLIERVFLVANLGIFWGYGVGFLAAPRKLGALLGFELTNATALADFRAMYGGLCLAVGYVFFRGLRDAAWRLPALWLAILSAGGLALGRLTTLAIDGVTSEIILGLLASEVVAVAVGLALVLKPAAGPLVAATPR